MDLFLKFRLNQTSILGLIDWNYGKLSKKIEKNLELRLISGPFAVFISNDLVYIVWVMSVLGKINNTNNFTEDL